MKSRLKMEDGILSVVALTCYVFALTASGIAAYALVTLSLTAYGTVGQGSYLTAQQF